MTTAARQRKSTVAIVEDNAPLGASLRQIVDSTEDLQCVGVWGTGEDALKKIDAFRPDVVLMDINLPGISGIEATARVRQALPAIQIIMVTVYADHDMIFAALKAGAAGYLLKRSSPSEVRDAIREVLSGGAPMSPEIARRVVETFRQPAAEDTADSDLSSRETAILEKLCEGLANKEIADRLGIAANTVRVHLRNIYEKLHVRSRTEAAMKYLKIRGRGA
ncbi:response regulator transcription factor [Luteolibacter ambystomatis]|uniref:Response regulator transcription factor n=1 Tax=Luteolibacter ambystomatis TaxID=2824561 RepID=A0A975G701_9BACT|nr:response regulator transcription factor [Luteolibacter ambystomatis]QUE49972.1 response regulator transcription factor [Luteolibacter ambystomatis]